MNSQLMLIVALGLLASGCAGKSGSQTQAGSQAQAAYRDITLMQAADTMIVYIIWDGKRRQVPDPQTLEALGVSSRVSMQPHEVIAAFPEGEPIPHLPGKLIQKASTGEVFILEGGKRRWVPDVETLESLGGSGQVHGVVDAVADSVPLGSPMPHVTNSAAPSVKANH